MAAASAQVPCLDTKQLGGKCELEEAPNTTRNRAAQCQASLVVKMPMLASTQDAAELLLEKGPVAEVSSSKHSSCPAADVMQLQPVHQCGSCFRCMIVSNILMFTLGIPNVHGLQEVARLYYTRLLEDTMWACPAGAALDLAMSTLGLTTSNVLSQTKVRPMLWWQQHEQQQLLQQQQLYAPAARQHG